MEDLIGLAFVLIVPASLFVIGYIFGGINERRHLSGLEEREARLKHFTVSQIKSYPGSVPGQNAPQMIVTEAVISSDYVKSFFGGLRNLFGGEVKSYRGLIDRARREATTRIMEEAEQLGYNAICNLRLETADIAGRSNNNKNKIIMAAIIASGTAYNVPSRQTD